MPHIKIDVSSLTEEEKHAVTLNKKGKWVFSSSNWVYGNFGSFKQVNLQAAKEYKRKFKTEFGVLYVTSFSPPKHKQKELF